MKSYSWLSLWVCLGILGGGTGCSPSEEARPKPHIIVILADDLGYGDLSLLQPEGKIKTPHLDALGREGMVFTDAHASASVCTPTRYGIMMGRYSWKSRMKRGVSWAFSPAILEPERTTLAEMVRRQGYATACIGKWHLGLNWAFKDGSRPGESWSTMVDHAQLRDTMTAARIDFSQPVSGGPGDHGFEYSFILPNSLDIPPYCFLENDKVLSAPSDSTQGNDLNTGYTEAFWRPGEISPGFEIAETLPRFFTEARKFIERSANGEQPFFLYLPLSAPHTPWVPTEGFVDKSRAGTYGDFVQMVDFQVGLLLNTLKQKGIEEETLILFTSDNGPYWRPNLIEQYKHRAAYHFRGMKGDIWDGGHRVPFLARWPGQIPAGTQSDQLVSTTDIMATLAGLLGVSLGKDDAEDSVNQWPVMAGSAGNKPTRTSMIHQSSQNHFAIRTQRWKYIQHRGSGGFSPPVREEPLVGYPDAQLYDMQTDPQEQFNLITEKTDLADSLSSLLKNHVSSYIQF